MLLGDIDDITVRWLNQVMDTDSITAFRAKRIGEGIGLMGILARVSLESEDSAVPDSVVVKIQTTDEQNLIVAHTYDTYGREVEYYRFLAGDCPMSSPSCYYAEFDRKLNRFVLVLQDLSSMNVIDQLEGSNTAQTMLCVEKLGRLHGSFWSQTSQPQFDWMYDFERAYGPVIDTIEAMLETSFERSSTAVPAATTGFLRKFASDYPSILPKLTRRQSFIHGDFRLDNVFFGKDYLDFLSIDWGNCGKGAPMWDLSYFMSTNVDQDLRRVIEKDAVGLYHDTILSCGVSDYSFAQCWQDYVWGVPFAFYIPIIVMSSMGAGNERGEELVQTMYDRGIAAMVDHETHTSGLV